MLHSVCELKLSTLSFLRSYLWFRLYMFFSPCVAMPGMVNQEIRATFLTFLDFQHVMKKENHKVLEVDSIWREWEHFNSSKKVFPPQLSPVGSEG